MGNNSTKSQRNLKCFHENQNYHCKTCNRNLCFSCKESHLKNLNTQCQIVVCKRYSDEEKAYICNNCEHSLCVRCKEMHMADLEMEDNDVICKKIICRHENKVFRCSSCKSGLCIQCKEKHDQNINTIYHGIIIKLTNCTHRDKKYYCNMCQCGLCVQCKEEHVLDLDTQSHEIVITNDLIEKEETCEIHPDITCDMWCLSCKRPVCSCCLKQRKHEIMELEYAYKTFRKTCRDRFVGIRSDVLPRNLALLAKMYSNLETETNTMRSKISSFHVDLSNRSRNLKDQMNMACKVKAEKLQQSKLDLVFKLRQSQREIMRYIASIEKYENKYEKCANKQVQFLLFHKKTAILKSIFDIITVSLHGTITMNDAVKLLEIQTIETRKRQIGKDELLERMSTPLFIKTFKVPRVCRIRNISLVTSDRFCVSDGEYIVLVDTAGQVLHTLRGISRFGEHTGTSDGNLIYIDKDYNINVLSKQYTTATLLKKIEPWIPHCIYSSPTTAELLVGMRSYDIYKVRYTAAKVVRYNSAGNLVQTIQQNNSGQNLYSAPNFIIENRSGDIIVSDWLYGIVVTDREGQHRFSYIGLPGRMFEPCGICTDVLSNILVCDLHTHTVQIIDKDGHFLSVLLTGSQGISEPWSLSYDDENHLLWIGSRNDQKICVYRHIRRRDILYTEKFSTPFYFSPFALPSFERIQNGANSNKIV